MSRVVQMKKAEKMQANLHMIDLPKENTHIRFISHLNELKTSKVEPEPVSRPVQPNHKLE